MCGAHDRRGTQAQAGGDGTRKRNVRIGLVAAAMLPQQVGTVGGAGAQAVPDITCHVTPLGQAGVIDLKVAGVGAVPANATAVALNVTETGSTAPPGGSYVTVWPTGSAQPLASNLNFYAGTSMPNMVISRVGTDGKVS